MTPTSFQWKVGEVFMKTPDLNFCIDHRNWTEALSEAFALLTCASPGEVVCITGPSRAGKSRLIYKLIDLLFGEDYDKDPFVIPCVVVEAVNSGPNGSFSTKSFTQRMLKAVNHPVLSIADDNEDYFAYHKLERSTEGTLRLALERAFVARQTKYLFIDEAQHARYTSKNTHAAHAVLDSWKCLAQTSGLVLVIVGAYPVLDILRNSPHMLGRKHQVHLPRYQMTVEDIKHFSKIVAVYDKYLTISDDMSGSLKAVCEMLYEGSLGCIGLLSAWLLRAEARGQISGSGITLELLKKARLSNADLAEIEREILTGEQGLLSGSKKKLPAQKSRNRKSPVKPFQRKPKRLEPGHRS